ncbi:hypothetical protein [Actinomadura sp. 21ATH]|uniref:hypothetical protein n=1 Tax=Actinomadura sp. 21ATH TaxID=1735444 RepID=UPI0035C08A5D
MNRDIDTLIGALAPVTDARAAELMPDESAADLADRITRTAVEPAAPRRRRSRGLTFGLPLAAGLACAAVALAAVAQDPAVQPPPNATGQSPDATGTAQSPNVRLASALTIKRKGDHIDVRVRDPLADPKRYGKELAAHGLKVELSLVPVSPSIVGTVVMMDTSDGTNERDITTITAKGECETGGGGDVCPVGVRVSTGYEGTAQVVFGRAARPGEQYNSAAPVTAPGEVMHGMTFRKKRVGEVLAALKKRNVTVPEYRYMDGNVSKDVGPDQIPPTWYVHDATPWAKNQVLLFVGPNPTE